MICKICEGHGCNACKQTGKELKGDRMKTCEWVRSFDQHFNIGCVNDTGERANGNFKGKDKGAKWEFIFCPYCGGKIVEVTPEDD